MDANYIKAVFYMNLFTYVAQPNNVVSLAYINIRPISVICLRIYVLSQIVQKSLREIWS
jgi:hypothetical protein